MRFYFGTVTERIAHYLREAQNLRRIAAQLSVHQARAMVLRSAVECEREALALQREAAAFAR